MSGPHARAVLTVEEQTLLAGCRRGDHAAWLALFRAYADDVGGFLKGMLRTGDVDDLVQKVFLSFITSLATYRGEASLRTWLLRIARHTALNEIRATSRRNRHLKAYAEQVETASPGPDRQVHARARLDLIQRLLASVDEDFREVWILREAGHCSVAEAAAVLEIPESTVRTRHYRARSQLFQLLGEIDAADAEALDGRHAAALTLVDGGDR